MTRAEFEALNVGAIIRHKLHAEAMVVIADHGNEKIAVRQTTVTNPEEWLLIAPSPVPPRA